MATKKEMIKDLKEKYGYSDADLKQDNGNPMTNKQLEELLKSEGKDNDFEELGEFVEEDIEEEEEIDDFFDGGIDEDDGVKFKSTDLITVMSGINGQFIHKSREDGKQYKFNGFGQTTKMPYSEIVSIRNLMPTVFEDCWLVILNKDLIEQFGFEELYKYILTPKNINKIFSKSPREIERISENLPRSMKVTLIDKARKMYKEGSLDSLSIINAIQNTMNISLEDNAPMKTSVKLLD